MLRLPRVIFLAGKKGVGKSFICELLKARAGYSVLHIAAPWLEKWWADRGYDFWTVTPETKATWREAIQRDAAEAREKDPDVLVKMLDDRIRDYAGDGLVVDGVRFHNEALYGISQGYFVAKVDTPDAVRRRRFIERGENLSLLDDPFERELGEDFPCHVILPGDRGADFYIPAISAAYVRLKEAGRRMREAA